MTRLENLRALQRMVQPYDGYDGGTAILTAEELELLLDVVEAVNGLSINSYIDEALARLNEEVESDS